MGSKAKITKYIVPIIQQKIDENAKLYDVNGDLLESKDYNTPKDTLATATIGIRITIKRE